MAGTALRILDNDPDGFFLFVEQEGIDEASHANDGAYLTLSMAEFSAAVQTVINWVDDPTNAADWSNTMVIVLADHETGGLTVTANNGQGQVPGMSWTTTGHTQTAVPVYAKGAGAAQITGVRIDNTNIKGLLIPAAVPTPTPTDTPLPTDTPVPTDTPLPTDTPTETPVPPTPTDTPIPTDTPTPTRARRFPPIRRRRPTRSPRPTRRPRRTRRRRRRRRSPGQSSTSARAARARPAAWLSPTRMC